MGISAEQFSSPDYWSGLAPGLHIGDQNVVARSFFATPEMVADFKGRLREEGYFQSRNDWWLDLPLMVRTVRNFAAADISPVFCFLFDEFWAPFHALEPLYRAFLGDYAMQPDFWVWNVDPAKGESGWLPHRDKGSVTLFPDGSPKSLTTWIALSPATPLNSCMYIVPANFDPDYATPREFDLQFSPPAARALPAEPGDFFMWNQAVLHWGSRSSARAAESRVSMAFEFQRADVAPFNMPLIEPGRHLSFSHRLWLISKQLLQYQHMYRLDPELEAFASALVKNPPR